MAAAQFKHWFEYFPNNFVWSQQMMSMIDMAAWGAGAMGEIDQVGQRLKDRIGDNDAWFDEWTTKAEEMETKAKAAARRQSPVDRRHLLPACRHLFPVVGALHAAGREEIRQLPALHAELHGRLQAALSDDRAR